MSIIDLKNLIELYYEERSLKWPSVNQSLDWALTELAEAKELLLTRDGDWVRNNPQDKPGYTQDRLSEEVGDIIMMCLVSGIVGEFNPIDSLIKKMKRKLDK